MSYDQSIAQSMLASSVSHPLAQPPEILTMQTNAFVSVPGNCVEAKASTSSIACYESH